MQTSAITLYVIYDPDYGYLDAHDSWTWDIRKIYVYEDIEGAVDAFDRFADDYENVVIRELKVRDSY